MKKKRHRISPWAAILAFTIGCLIAFSGLSDAKKMMFGPLADPIVAIVLGGLYGLEKLYQRGRDDQDTNSGQDPGEQESKP